MIIYELRLVEKDYMSLDYIQGDEYSLYFFEKFYEDNFDYNQKPPRIKLLKELNGRNYYKFSDFIYDSGVPIFSEKAKKVLEDMLLKSGNFFEIENVDKVHKYSWKGLKRFKNRYFALNITNRVDCLNLEKSNRDKNGFSVNEVYFFEEKIDKNLDIFKVKMLNYSNYVTQDFVDRIIHCGLKGFSFKPVWSSYNEPLGDTIDLY